MSRGTEIKWKMSHNDCNYDVSVGKDEIVDHKIEMTS